MSTMPKQVEVTLSTDHMQEWQNVLSEIRRLLGVSSTWEKWMALKEVIGLVKDAEMESRKKLFHHFFLNPKEGTNKMDLNDGWVLKVTNNIERKIDEAALTTLAAEFAQNGIEVRTMVKYKPELAIRNYRELTAEQQQLFDHALIIKEGSPQMELVPPKQK